MWSLFKLYEGYLSINNEISFPSLLGHDRQKFLCLDAGIIEDSQSSHAFLTKEWLRRKVLISSISTPSLPDGKGFN